MGESSDMAWRGKLFTIFICLLASIYYYNFFFNRAYVDLELSVSKGATVKIYWADRDEPFSEDRRSLIQSRPARQEYRFFIADLDRIDKLRIDPLDHSGSVLIRKIDIVQKGFDPIHIDLEALKPLSDIERLFIDEQGLHVISKGNDPNLLYFIDKRVASIPLISRLAPYFFICLLLIIAVRSCRPLRKDFAYVPLMLAMVFMLVVSMAAVSKRNAHPDEYVHLDAARYYEEHWLPPQIEDPLIEQTYSAYGISRLNNGEIYYLFAGKFAKLLESTHIDELLALRFFNILLFGCIVLYAIASKHARLVALPFLITPQVWYLFSYCVSDAFGLFLCFLAGCELVRPESFLNRLLDAKRKSEAVSYLAVGGLLALLLLLKINYYPFAALFFMIIAWRWYQTREGGGRRILFTRIVIFGILGLCLASVRVGADYYVNGLDRQEKLTAMQEKTAHTWYKPSTELHKKHISLFLKQRGTSLKELVKDYQWFEHSFVTAVGVYGYFTIAAPQTYYELVRWTLIVLFFYISLTIVLRGTGEKRVLLGLTIMLAAALIGASLHRSWTVDLQAQGRYLFPILPLFGVVLAECRDLLQSRIFNLLVVQLFVLSVYSFIFVALYWIPRPI